VIDLDITLSAPPNVAKLATLAAAGQEPSSWEHGEDERVLIVEAFYLNPEPTLSELSW
jgi:hypothetical protein